MLRKRYANKTLTARSNWGIYGLACATVCGMLTLSGNAHAGKQLTRESAEVTGIDGKVILVPETADPATFASTIQIYNNTVTTPGADNVIYVSIVGTAFSEGNGIAMNCQVDGVNCLAGEGTAGGGSVDVIPPGWIIPLGTEFGTGNGYGDTGFSYHWCAPIVKSKKNAHVVTINLASAFGVDDAFVEAVQVFVDSNKINGKQVGDLNVCGSYPTPNGTDSPD